MRAFIPALLLLGCSPNETGTSFTQPLQIPIINQDNYINNCGPSSAAMIAAEYTHQDPIQVRNRIGQWTWDRFYFRRLPLGKQKAATTAEMLKAALSREGVETLYYSREDLYNPQTFIHETVTQGKPILALVKTKYLWNTETPGNHWVVITGYERGRITYHDPAYGAIYSLPETQFLTAWTSTLEALVPINTLGGLEPPKTCQGRQNTEILSPEVPNMSLSLPRFQK